MPLPKLKGSLVKRVILYFSTVPSFKAKYPVSLIRLSLIIRLIVPSSMGLSSRKFSRVDPLLHVELAFSVVLAVFPVSLINDFVLFEVDKLAGAFLLVHSESASVLSAIFPIFEDSLSIFHSFLEVALIGGLT